jgi:DNA-binding NtrC family response regulator
MPSTPNVKILVADDEKASRMALEIPLRLSGYEVTTAAGGREAIALGRERRFDIALVDIYMPDLNGLEVLHALREIDPRLRVIVLTAQGSLEIALRAIEEGAFEFIAKPYAIEEMLALVERAAGHPDTPSAPAPDAEASFSASGLIGHSPAMVRAYKLTAQAARSHATVLIEGESGTGKELIARAIHRHSARASHPFTAVNCSALTETLLESELFGYTKGSFTGAQADRAGLFESTEKGTIFLDELAGTSPSFQASLLRVLQEKEVRRVGGREARPIDVRVIGATNRNLEEMVAREEFRADLFYRLGVLTIQLPPLRERGEEDIALLIHHFLRGHTRERGDEIRISEAALDLLGRYSWPGNVRELENTIAHAVAVCNTSLITVDDLPSRIVERALPPTPVKPRAVSLIDDRPSLAELDRRYAQLILSETEGNKSRAAEILGIDRRTIYRLLEMPEAAE